MKLKGLLSASLLLACLAVTAAAQQRPLEYRQGDALRGPVKSARIEHADFSRVEGVLVEGPRRLSVVLNYTPDGRRKEYEGYSPDGAVSVRRVFVYDDSGNEVEQSVFDGKGRLQTRVVGRPAAGEVLTYNGDGSLRERKVTAKTPDGVEEMVYDGDGALKERSVVVREGGVSVMRAYKPDGTLKKSIENGRGGGGLHRSVAQTYRPDGTVYGRRLAEVSDGGGMTDMRVVNEGYNPGARKTRETREYDSRKNLSKMTSYVWNEEKGEYEPSSVTYYIITYYR